MKIATTAPYNYAKSSSWEQPDAWTKNPNGFWMKYFEIDPTFTSSYNGNFGFNLTSKIANKLSQTKKDELAIADQAEGFRPLAEFFNTIRIKEKPYYSIVEDLLRIEILPDHIVKLNGEVFEESDGGVEWTKSISSITLDDPLTTYKFLWYCHHLIEKFSAHDYLYFAEIFQMGGLPSTTRKNTTVYMPPTQEKMANSFARLYFGFGLPPNLLVNAESIKAASMNQQLIALKKRHVTTFSNSTGRSEVACMPPFEDLLSTDDLENHPSMAINRFSIKNFEFRATPIQRQRYYEFQQSRMFNSQLVRWSGRCNSMRELPLTWCGLLDSPQLSEKSDLDCHEDSVHKVRSLRFGHKLRLCNHPSGGLKLSTQFALMYKRIYCRDEFVDKENLTEELRQSLLLPVGGDLQKYCDANIASTVNEKFSKEGLNATVKTACEENLKELVQTKMTDFAKKSDIDEMKKKQIEQDQKLSTVATDLKAASQQAAATHRMSTLNASLIVGKDPAILDVAPGLKKFIRPAEKLKEDSAEMEKALIAAETFRRAITKGAAIKTDSIPAPVANGDEVDYSNVPTISMMPDGIDFELSSDEEEVDRQVIPDLPIKNRVPVAHASTSDFGSVAGSIDEKRSDVRNHSLSALSLDELSFDEEQCISRTDIAAPNAPFNKNIGSVFKANFSERRSAFKRKWAYELTLTPYLYNQYKMIFLLYHYEFIHIVRKIAYSETKYHNVEGIHYDNPLIMGPFNKPRLKSAKFQSVKGLQEECIFLLEQLRAVTVNESTIIRFVRDNVDIDLPFITIQLLTFIIDIFQSEDFLIPYVGGNNFRAFLKEFFNKLLPSECPFLQKLNQLSPERNVLFRRINFERSLNYQKKHRTIDSFTYQAFADLSLNSPKLSVSSECSMTSTTFPVTSSPRPQTAKSTNWITKVSNESSTESIDSIFSDFEIEQIFQDTMETPRMELKNPKFKPTPVIDIGHIYEPHLRYNIEEVLEEKLTDLERENNFIAGDRYLIPPLDQPKSFKSDNFLMHLRNKTIPSIHDPLILEHLPLSIKLKAQKLFEKESIRISKTEKKKKSTAENAFSTPKNFFTIGYANLHKPMSQINLLFRAKTFEKVDVIALNELDIDPIAFSSYISVPIGYSVFFHEPVLANYSGLKKPRIYSAFLVRRSPLMKVKQMKSRAPCTSIFVTHTLKNGNEFSMNISTVYRTHYDSHCKNRALNIYQRSDNPATCRSKHNEFYSKLYSNITRKLQSKVPGIIVGDFNVNFENPRPQDSKIFCKNLRLQFGLYDQLVRRPTNHTHTRHPQSNKNIKSHNKIDFFLAKNVKGTLSQRSGDVILGDGHDILLFRSNLERSYENSFYEVHTRSKPDRKDMFRVGLKYFYTYKAKLDEAYQIALQQAQTFTSLDSTPRTNVYTKLLIEVLEKAVTEVTHPVILKIPTGPMLNKPSPYTKLIRRELYQIHSGKSKKDISDRELHHAFVLRKMLRHSIKTDHKRDVTKCDVGEMKPNEVFQFTRTFNPKDKIAINNRGNHTPNELLDYYVQLQTKDALPVDGSLDIWPELNRKLNLEDFEVKWKGKTVRSSLQKCLYACRPHTKGIDSNLTGHTLGMFPAEFAEYICKMHEVDLKSGMCPEIHRTTRLTVIPKLSHPDLAQITANRCLSLVHILTSLESKHVSRVVNDVLKDQDYFSDNQMGFREGRGCDTLLALLISDLEDLPKSHTATVTLIDGINAFGSVSRDHICTIFDKIAEEPINRYLQSIFLPKTVTLINNGERSRTHTMPADCPGTPQGYSLSPTIYNLVSLLIPALFAEDPFISVYAFADDISVMCHHENYDECIKLTQKAILRVEFELRQLGVGMNTSKTEMFVYGKTELSFNGHFPIDSVRCIPEKLAIKLLGLRFTATLDIEPQFEFLCRQFDKYRALVNCALLSNSRISLINLIQSTYYGSLQFSCAVWPVLESDNGNRLARHIAQAIQDIYGLGEVDEEKMKHSYRKLFGMTGLSFPNHTQAKMIVCFANRLLYKVKESPKRLRQKLLNILAIKVFGKEKNFEELSPFNRRILLSVNKCEIIIKKPRGSSPFFPGNVPLIFRKLPAILLPEWGSPQFNRLAKVHFKYKCPHRMSLSVDKCVNCLEQKELSLYLKGYLSNLLIKNDANDFSVFDLTAENVRGIVPIHIKTRINRSFLSAISPFIKN